MHLLHSILLTAGILNFSGGLASVISWIFIRKRSSKAIKNGDMVSIIIPFKGKKMDNIRYFLNQDYCPYEVIVAVDTLREKRRMEKEFKARVIVSKNYPNASGKLSAILSALEVANGEIYVFADADIKPHEKWLSYLVGGVGENKIATSYRWYSGNKILSVWNASVASILFYDALNFAWGGSTAIRKKDFEKLGLREIWENEIVDDLTLTMVAKKNGYRIEFIPEAISEGDDEEDALFWMNREMAWVKHYFPSLWKLSFFINIGMRIAIIAGIATLFFYPYAGILMLSPLFFDFLRGWQEHKTFHHFMKRQIHPWYIHALLRPLVSFIISYNLISSAFMREVEWGSKKYKLVAHKI